MKTVGFWPHLQGLLHNETSNFVGISSEKVVWLQNDQFLGDDGNNKTPEESQLEHPEKPLPSIDVKAEKPQLEKVDSAGLQIASSNVVSSLVSQISSLLLHCF